VIMGGVLAQLTTLVFAVFPALALAAEPAAGAPECPSPAQLGQALNVLVPGLAPSPATATPLPLASGLRLGVSTSPEGDVRVDLTDAQGELVLHRVLPAPPRGRAPDCPALAETIALIVDRYLHDVGYEAPTLPPPAPKPTPVAPPPPPPPTEVAITATPTPSDQGAEHPARLWRLGLAAVARRGDVGGLDGDGDLALGVEGTGDGARLGGRLSVGFAPPADARWSAQNATLRRLPLRLGGYLRFAAGPGQLEPGVGLGADLFLVSAQGPGTAGGVHTSVSGDVALGYALSLPGPLYVRLLSRVALAVPYSFKTLAGTQVWGTPRAYAEGGVELGFAFP
jgi:hypothetical protein